MLNLQGITATISDFFAAMRTPPLPLGRDEGEWERYFAERVVPLRQRLLKTAIDDVRPRERDRAHFLISYGETVFRFVDALRELTPYAAQQLCAYIDRETAQLN